MRAALALWRHESKAILKKPSTTLWLSTWCVLASFSLFASGNFWTNNRAELTIFFQSLPWMGCFFLPYLTMNHWARERELGTFVWHFSLPQSLISTLLIRYLVCWQVLFLALLGTWPLAASLFYLGKPDPGALFAGYCGSLSILSLQLAIGMIASSLCDRRLSAYLLGLGFCLLLHIPGLEQLAEPISQLSWLGNVRKLQSLGSARHLSAALRGVIDSRDLTYACGGTILSLSLSGLLLQWQRRFLNLRFRYLDPSILIGIGLLFLASLGLVQLSRSTYERWDWTQERLYTLSEGTRAIVDKIQEPIDIQFFFSRSHAELSPSWKAYGQHIEELLREYARLAPHKLRVRIIDPKTGSPDELQARVLGLFSQTSSEGDPLFLGANLKMGTRNLPIPYLDPEKEDQLEYELSEALVKIDQSRKPVLGVLSSLPMVGDQSQGSLQLRQDWALTATLRKLYEVIELAPNTERIPDSVSSLLVIHPKNLSERTEFAIDQFLLRGGNLVIAVDPFCRSEMLFQAGRNPNSELASTLPRLFAAWGLAFDPGQMVGDPARASSIQSPLSSMIDPFQLSLQIDDLNLDNPITQKLEDIRLIETGWFDASQVKGLSWETLVSSSPQSAAIATRSSQVFSAQQLSKNLSSEGKQRSLAGILSGRFQTAFAEAPKGSPITNPLKNGAHEQAIVIFADVDFMTDLRSIEKLSSSGLQSFRPINDNLALVQKSVEYVGGNRNLIHIRSSSRRPRPLSRVRMLEEQSQKRYQNDIDQINSQLVSLQDRLALILTSSEQFDEALPSVQRDDLRNMRKEEAQLRAERRKLQHLLTESSQWLTWELLGCGALGTPLLMLCAHLYVWRRRQKLNVSG